MAQKPTDDVGKAQWRRIAATVKPMKKARSAPSPPAGEDRLGLARQRLASLGEGGVIAPKPAPNRPPLQVAVGAKRQPSLSSPAGGEGAKGAPPSTTLDSTWDRRIRTGRIEPDFTIDLHGHNLASAHSQLARALDRAERDGARVILLIAGKHRGPDEAPRGAIRRELETWLAHSRHAGRIAAVRTAHPRHGGAGALYLVLRRQSPL